MTAPTVPDAPGTYLGRRLERCAPTTCTECGSDERKIKRVEATERFCVNCYERLYVRKACVGCAKVARIHRHLTHGRCRECVLGPRVCQRCDKPFVRAGRVANGRWVCPSCAPHFRLAESCERCGVLSKRLARASESGHKGRVCPRCQRTHHKTCARCHRHRKAVRGTDGRYYCAGCSGATPPEHFCADCTKRLPGNGNGRCRECIAREQLGGLARLVSAGFESAATHVSFREFVSWRVSTCGAQACAKNLRKEAEAFHLFERHHIELTSASPSRLLELMSPEAWRQVTNVQRFLAERYRIHFQTTEKLSASDNLRIERILKQASEEPHGSLLADYRASLAQNNEPLKLRTQRLYLGVADKFLRSIGVASVDELATCAKVAWVLKQNPSMYTSLSRFATWCNQQTPNSLKLQRPAPRSSDAMRSNRLRERVSNAIRILESDPPASNRAAAIISILSAAYGMTTQSILSVRRRQLDLTGENGVISIGAPTKLDRTVTSALRSLCQDISADDYVFPGRVPGQPLSAVPLLPVAK